MNEQNEKSCKVCVLAVEGSEEVRQAAELDEFEEGEKIIREGEPTRSIFFLCKGDAIIQKKLKGEGRQAEIARIGEGSVVGEMEFLTGENPAATVIAGNNCVVHRLPADKFKTIIHSGNDAAIDLLLLIARVLAYRLFKMDDKVVELLNNQEEKDSLKEFARFKQKLLNEWDF